MEYLNFTLYTGAALLCGAVLGLERQYNGHPAGLRTNALVSVGAALFVSVSHLFAHQTGVDPTRITSYIVTGIGFLGGGVILREGFNVRGMNTAATLWCTAAIGTLAGSGFLREATVGAAAILAILVILRPLVHRLDRFTKVRMALEALYRLRVVCNTSEAAVVRAL